MSSSEESEPRGHSLIADLIPILVIGVGISVIVGWALDSALLKSVIPGLTAMNPMTAVAFIFSGVALRSLNHQRYLLARLFSAIVVGIAVLVLAAIVFGWEIGIDRLLFADKLQAEPGLNRMAPNTALSFLLVGAAFFLMSRDAVRWAWVTQILVMLAGTIAYFAVIGYLYGAESFYGVPAFTPMAFNTTCTFLILCLSALAVQPDAGPMVIWRMRTSSGTILRYALPTTIIAIVVMGGVKILGINAGLSDLGFAEAAMAVLFTLLLSVGMAMSALRLNRAELERIRIETALRESEARYRLLFDSSSDAILILDGEGCYVDANQQAERLTGYTRDEILTLRVGVLAPTREMGLTEFQRLTASGYTFIEQPLLRKDGSQIIAEILASQVSLTPALYQLIVRDISERKQAEESLRLSLEQERRLNELKSRFVAMVSHEFRTPLAVIRSSTDLLLHYGERTTPERQQERLVKIQQEISIMVQLLDDILILRRAEDSNVAFKPESLDLSVFCTSLIAEVQPAMTSHQIEFSSSGDCMNISADPKLLRQAITNLITNAVKYSPERPNIQLELICGEKEVILHVRDEGIGIPEEDQSKLFEVFHRASNVGSISGTGLGLAIIKQAVEAHGGSIVCASEQNIGTTFTISLPRRVGIQPSLSGS